MAQLDDREMLANHAEADVKIESSAASTAKLYLRLSTRRTSRPTPPLLESWCATSGRLSKVDFIGSPDVQPGMWPIAVVQAHDETPIVPRLLFRTGGTPGME
jgi:hypothetical protein